MYPSLILFFPLRLHPCDLHQTITNNFISSLLPGSAYSMLPYYPVTRHSSQLLKNLELFPGSQMCNLPDAFSLPRDAVPSRSYYCPRVLFAFV